MHGAVVVVTALLVVEGVVDGDLVVGETQVVLDRVHEVVLVVFFEGMHVCSTESHSKPSQQSPCLLHFWYTVLHFVVVAAAVVEGAAFELVFVVVGPEAGAVVDCVVEAVVDAVVDVVVDVVVDAVVDAFVVVVVDVVHDVVRLVLGVVLRWVVVQGVVVGDLDERFPRTLRVGRSGGASTVTIIVDTVEKSVTSLVIA